MNTNTGQLVSAQALDNMSAAERSKFIVVKRDLSAKELADMQIRKYAPCACGSGRKFKFCCYQKEKP